MTFSQNVKWFRTKKGMTQEQLASALGISAQAVSKWETTDTYPDCTLLCELSKVLGASLDELFDNHVSSMRELSRDIFDLITGTPYEEQFHVVRELCWQIEKALFSGKSEKWWYFDNEVQRVTNHSYVLSEAGFTHVSNGPSPFFAVFPQYGSSYSDAIGDGEKIRQIFEILASPETMTAVLFLLKRRNGLLFEAEVLAEHCGIAEDRLDPVMEDLLKLGIISKGKIEIDGVKHTLYHTEPDHRLVALLLFADELTYPGPYTMRLTHRRSPLLK